MLSNSILIAIVAATTVAGLPVTPAGDDIGNWWVANVETRDSPIVDGGANWWNEAQVDNVAARDLASIAVRQSAAVGNWFDEGQGGNVEPRVAQSSDQIGNWWNDAKED